ncbi:MAG: YfbM family protein [Armatimonadetes bacterium]|nr:YfbM family protein [Armatimonadota bacterium]
MGITASYLRFPSGHKAEVLDNPPLYFLALQVLHDPDRDKWVGDEEEIDWRILEAGGWERLDIDRNWEGIHYLLTEQKEPAPSPLSHAIFGKRRIQRGAGLFFNPTEEVERVAEALSGVDQKDMEARYNPLEMKRRKIYPEGWDLAGEEGLGRLLESYNGLAQFYHRAAREGTAVLIEIG